MILQIKCITHTRYKNNGKKYTLNDRPGNYSLMIRAFTEAGYGNYSQPVYFKIEESSSNSTSIIVTILMALFVVSVSVFNIIILIN